MIFQVRLIDAGRVVNTGTVEADSRAAAVAETLSPLMDPIIQCRRGEPVQWIEIGNEIEDEK